MKKIALIGFMGSGKSSVGRILIEKLGGRLVDTDARIVEKAGTSINDIFEKHGEAYFRNLESEVLKETLESDATVICTGGGIVLRDENRKMLNELSKVVYLKASAKTVYDRVYNDESRPLLKGKKSVEEIQSMMDSRQELYDDCAMYTVVTDNKSVDKIVAEILEL